LDDRKMMLRAVSLRRLRVPVAPLLIQQQQSRFLGSRSNEPPLEPGFMEKYKLDDPSRFVPIGLGAGALAAVTGLYVSFLLLQLRFCW
jgi:hypothetical protein